DAVLAANRGTLGGLVALRPTDVDEERDLHGHPGKHEPALKQSAPFWSTSGNYAETAFRNIFQFPFKGLRFSMVAMQRQLAAEKSSVRYIARLNPLFLQFLSHSKLINLTHHSTRKTECGMNRE